MLLCTLLLPIFSVLYGIWIFLLVLMHALSSIALYWILRFIPCFGQGTELEWKDSFVDILNRSCAVALEGHTWWGDSRCL
ncbi:hypothetical protein P171DRAFT_118863 [Karstenula rhodostoma CBS 690.94]|uniref:Uncharacterized protein n=1 Tax=Karstenula rhodostoma CBS 690.94 TaxID=1392251 RepID=A0A9P4PA85_9PLEO|nr:hypothetical protein P171DRAFT_118863 [Karstenula rhodostoma CBS 690.94]